jgi:hypothetical protein
MALSPSLCMATNSQFGIVWGLSVPDADNTGVFHIFGVKGEEFMTPQISFGGYFFVSDHSGENSDADKFRYSLTGVETAYHLPSGSGDTFIAVRMGVTKLRMTPNGNDVTYSPYHYGVATGYDYFMTSWLALGFEGSYLHVLPGRTNVVSGTYDLPSFNIISFLITMQFRL